MPDKSSTAELVWLLRLHQGTFFEPQLTWDRRSVERKAVSIPFSQGEADSSLSVLTRSSESANADSEDP